MIRRAAALAVAALALAGGRARPVFAGEDAAAPRPETYPLVFMVQADADLDSSPAAGGDDPPTGGSAVRLRRLRVGEDLARGAWRARAVLEASSPDTPFAPVEGGRLPLATDLRLTEAFVAFRPHRAFELDLGATRVPFSLSRQVDEADLRLPERPQEIVALAPDYRTGLSVGSDLGLLNVRLSGVSADTSFDGHLFTSGYLGAARLAADPIGPMGVTPWLRRRDDPWSDWWRFSAGVSVLYGTLLAPRTLALGGDAQLQWRRVTVTGEYIGQHVATASSSSLPYQGADVEPGVFLVESRFELVLRGAWYRQPSPPPALSGSTETFAGGGALTFFAWNAHLRAQAGLELRHTLDHRLPDSGWAIIRATLVL